MISRNYLAIAFGLAARSVALTLLVMILARVMGSDIYGGYAAAVSVANLIATFSGLGATALHVRDVARGSMDHRTSLGIAASRVLRTATPLAAICVIVNWFAIPHNVPALLVAIVAVGEILSVIATDLAFRAMQAQERYISMAVIAGIVPVIRLCLAVMAWFFDMLTFEVWAWMSFFTGLAALALVIRVVRQHTRGSFLNGNAQLKFSSSDALSGLGFTLSTASARIHGDADKVILARLASTSRAGQYAVAYRLTDVLTLPIVAAIEHLLPTLFRQGKSGFSESLRKLIPMIVLGLAGGGVLSAVGYFLAPLLPLLLGKSYEGSVEMARALSLVPLTMAIWSMVRAVAGTTGHEKAMGAAELTGASINVAMCILAVTVYGWLGAVYATYATHLSMSVGLLGWIVLQERRHSSKASLQKNFH